MAQELEMGESGPRMQAVVFDAPGGPDVLHTASVDAPVPGATEVRLRCKPKIFSY